MMSRKDTSDKLHTYTTQIEDCEADTSLTGFDHKGNEVKDMLRCVKRFYIKDFITFERANRDLVSKSYCERLSQYILSRDLQTSE